MITEITENNIEEFIKDEISIIIFYAEWSNPSKMMLEICEELSDNVKVGKVDIDEEERLKFKNKLRQVPTFKIFKDGNEVKTFIGLTSKIEIEKHLEEANL